MYPRVSLREMASYTCPPQTLENYGARTKILPPHLFSQFGLLFPCKSYRMTLTALATVCGLCNLSVRTLWKTSTTPSVFNLSRSMLIAMYTPVLPHPSLQKKRQTSDVRITWSIKQHTLSRINHIRYYDIQFCGISTYKSSSATLVMRSSKHLYTTRKYYVLDQLVQFFSLSFLLSKLHIHIIPC